MFSIFCTWKSYLENNESIISKILSYDKNLLKMRNMQMCFVTFQRQKNYIVCQAFGAN